MIGHTRGKKNNHFDRATWGAIAIDICIFRGRSNQLRQDRPKPARGVEKVFRSGVAKVSARLISEHKYFANFSASRIVKFLVAAWKTASRSRYVPRNHSSAAIVMNNLANLSWMEVNEIVNFACNHKSREGAKVVWLVEYIRLRLRPIHHGFQLVGGSGDLVFGGVIWRVRIGGHQDPSAKVASARSQHPWCLALQPRKDLPLRPPSGPVILLVRGLSWSFEACSR